MENTITEDFEDSLSFCDLSFSDQELDSNLIVSDHQNSSSEFFQFSTPSSIPKSESDSVLFCGKLISSKSNPRFDASNQTLKSDLAARGKNLRSLSSKNNGSRKQRVIIGLAKMPSKMELSDLRERHRRRTAEKGREMAVVSGGKSRRWGLLRPFRSDFGSLLTRSSSSSIGCLRLARPCFD